MASVPKIKLKNSSAALLNKQPLYSVANLAKTLATLAAISNIKDEFKSPFGSSLYFPSDLGSQSYPYYISFGFQQYQRRSIFDQPFLNDIGTIRLPIPNTLIDSQDLYFATEENSLIIGSAIENALKKSNSVADMAKQVLETAATAAVVAPFTKTVPNGAFQLAGVAQNPFLTVLFKAPRFKRFQFSWKFAPNNAQETEIIANIINKFKYHQLPDISPSSGGTLLTYPDMCIVQLYPDDRYLFKFKPCVVESVTINYTPEGKPAFFSTNDAPAIVEFTINLLEIEYWTKKDILLSQGLK